MKIIVTIDGEQYEPNSLGLAFADEKREVYVSTAISQEDISKQENLAEVVALFLRMVLNMEKVAKKLSV